MLGANGMVGGGFPIAVGAGLRNKYLKTKKDVAVCFFGDGAANEGTFHEGINNMASIWKLPVILLTKITHLRKQHRNGIHPVLKQSPNVQQHMAFPV